MIKYLHVRINTHLTYHKAGPLVDIYLREVKLNMHTKTCMRKLLAVSFQNVLTTQWLELINRNIMFISLQSSNEKEEMAILCIYMDE